MTEKRFTVNYKENTRLYEVKDNLHILDCGGFAIEYNAKKCCEELNTLHEENEQLKQQLKELKEDVPLLLAFYRWYPFAVEKKEHQAYNRLWDFVND